MAASLRAWDDMQAEWLAHHGLCYKHTDLCAILLDADRRMQSFLQANPEDTAALQRGEVTSMAASSARAGSEAARTSDVASVASRRRPRSASRTGSVSLDKSGVYLADEHIGSGDSDEEGDARGEEGIRGNTDDGEPPTNGTLNSPNYADLFHDLVKIQAPMVRCSRPAFRRVCRLWGTDISYTHMMMAESIANAPPARHAEFALYKGEDRLVVQLAAKDGPTAARAAVLLAPFCDAFDLNCGCPQRWAMKEGLGSALLEKPEAVADVVKCIRGALSAEHAAVPCVVKMRVYDDVRRSVDFARHVAVAGAGWVTVHGRTPTDTPTARVRWEAIRAIREALHVDRVPVVANGGVVNPSTAVVTAIVSTVGSVMAGNGLLDNPALFYLPKSGQAVLDELTFLPTQAASVKESVLAGGVSPEASFMWGPSTPEATTLYRAHQQRNLLSVCRPTYANTTGRSPFRPLWGLPTTPLEVVSDYLRAAVVMDLPYVTTAQQLVRMARAHLSPSERVQLSCLKSNAAILAYLCDLGLYTPKGNLSLP